MCCEKKDGSAKSSLGASVEFQGRMNEQPKEVAWGPLWGNNFAGGEDQAVKPVTHTPALESPMDGLPWTPCQEPPPSSPQSALSAALLGGASRFLMHCHELGAGGQAGFLLSQSWSRGLFWLLISIRELCPCEV